MLQRNVAGVFLGIIVVCLIVTAYSVGRIHGMQQTLRMPDVAPTPEERARLNVREMQATQAEMARVTQAQTTEAEQKAALADAKLIGLALTMYAHDYDEALPPQGDAEEFGRRIGPYLKDPKALEAGYGASAFQYTLDNAAMSDTRSRANTPVGHKETRDGRAQVYADGQVRWTTPAATPGQAPQMLP